MKTKKTQKGGLYKLTLQYWRDDIEYMRKAFPNNYTAEVREILSKYVDRHKKTHGK